MYHENIIRVFVRSRSGRKIGALKKRGNGFIAIVCIFAILGKTRKHKFWRGWIHLHQKQQLRGIQKNGISAILCDF
ncbi:hypothetical protein L596_029082 [Steinernema carpocapsae]|uniref:Uncharacterized protein n=1 Tax=Steinernema carpocapsae TaxID=34508 RepID=A0A4U5LTK9_STECR|nr:hypothetical protein L596_029082 [Steinernema carpocapsae]